MPPPKHRVFTGVIYPDSESYNYLEILENIKKFSEYAYITHDSDFNEDNTPKKVHIHYVIRCPTPRSINSIAKELGVTLESVQIGKNFKQLIRYLIHLDNDEKSAYTADKIITNIELSRYLQVDSDELTQAETLLNFIMEENITSASVLIKYAIRSGSYSVLRRNSTLWLAVLKENRDKI